MFNYTLKLLLHYIVWKLQCVMINCKVVRIRIQGVVDYLVITWWHNSDRILKIIDTHTTVLLLCWNLSGTTRVSRHQKRKTRKGKTNLDLLEQEIVSGSGICWAICKSVSHPRQPRQHPTTQFFYRPDTIPAAQPTASKHWRSSKHWRKNQWTAK